MQQYVTAICWPTHVTCAPFGKVEFQSLDASSATASKNVLSNHLAVVLRVSVCLGVCSPRPVVASGTFRSVGGVKCHEAIFALFRVVPRYCAPSVLLAVQKVSQRLWFPMPLVSALQSLLIVEAAQDSELSSDPLTEKVSSKTVVSRG